jgi:hypothetical protein
MSWIAQQGIQGHCRRNNQRLDRINGYAHRLFSDSVESDRARHDFRQAINSQSILHWMFDTHPYKSIRQAVKIAAVADEDTILKHLPAYALGTYACGQF